MYGRVVRVNLPTAFVYGHEYWLDAGCRLCHDAHGTCRGNGEACDVSAAVLLHSLVELRGCLAQATYERVVLLALHVEYLECSTLLGECY